MIHKNFWSRSNDKIAIRPMANGEIRLKTCSVQKIPHFTFTECFIYTNLCTSFTLNANLDDTSPSRQVPVPYSLFPISYSLAHVPVLLNYSLAYRPTQAGIAYIPYITVNFSP